MVTKRELLRRIEALEKAYGELNARFEPSREEKPAASKEKKMDWGSLTDFKPSTSFYPNQDAPKEGRTD